MERMVRLLISSLAFLVIVCGLGAFIASAQSGGTTSSITGIVADEQGSILPGITVKARNVETNLSREVNTDEAGAYLLSQLTPGSYEITVSAEGFTTKTSKLDLALGTTIKLNVAMQIGVTSDIVEVTATNLIEEAKTESSTNIDRQRIESLPINKRTFLDFTLTSPRVTADRVPAQGAAATSGLSFNGQNGRVNNITIDGLDNNDFGTGSVRSTFSQDAVQEFQVVSDSYSAEFGRALGGVVNIITRGGGNDIHGSLFFLNRSDSTSARDVFTPFKPEYKQYQFGTTIGGPIKKDKLFYFLSFERLSIKQSNFVTISDQAVQAGQRNGFAFRNGPIPFSIGNTSFLARADYRLSPSDSLVVRYNYGGNYNGSFEPFGGLTVESSASLQRLSDKAIAASNTYVSTKLNLTNETRFLYSKRIQAVDPLDGGPQLRIVAPEGQINAGRSTFSPQPRDLRVYQIINNTSLTKGRQTLKVGVDYNYTNTPNLKTEVPVFGGGLAFFNPIDFGALTGIPGLPVFSGLQAFDPGSRTPAQQAFLQIAAAQLPVLAPGFPSGVPLTQLSLPTAYLQGFGDPRIIIAAKLFSTYFQDDIKVKPNLTLKLGVRYDRNDVTFEPSNAGNLAPRVGLAYRPGKLPKLSLRASYGLFFAAPVTGPSFVIGRSVTNQLKLVVTPFPFAILPFAQPGHHFADSVTIPNGLTFIPQLSQRFVYDKNTVNSYTQQTSFGFDYLLGNNTAFSFSYEFVRGLKILSQRDINPIVNATNNPVTSAITGRPDPTTGTVYNFESAFDSYYHGVTFSINRRFTNRIGFLANYTFSKGLDNYIDIRADLSEPQFPLNPRQERGLSLQDVRNRIVISGTFDIGYNKNVFLKDFQLSSIVTATSGRPYNLLAGVDLDRNGDNPISDRPLINGTPVGRNVGIAPGFTNVDIRLVRNITFKDRFRIQGSLEGFNILNHTNISDIDRFYQPDASGNFNLPDRKSVV